MYLCLTELFEIELFICIKINLALNDLQRLICHKIQINKQTKQMSLWCGEVSYPFAGMQFTCSAALANWALDQEI